MTNLKRPAGTKDYLPELAEKKRYIEECLNDAFSLWGYREVITPTFEFYDLLSAGTEVLQTKMYKFFNREGEIMALRPEMTAPIARLAAKEMKDRKLPLRLSYCSNVFRHESPRAGQYREFYQTGVELLGIDSPMGDTEVIAVAVEAIAKKLGVKNFNLDISDVDYYIGIMEEAGLDNQQQEKIRKSLSEKNLVELEELLVASNLTEQQQKAILASNDLRGGKEVLVRAKKLINNKKSKLALENLASVYENLESFGLAEYVTIDLSVVRKFNYYTGTIFEGYTKDLGYTICGGGRYDALVKKFGYPVPAIGFAIGIDRLLLSLEKQDFVFAGQSKRSLIIFSQSEKETAFKLANQLRANDEIAELKQHQESLAEILAYAKDKKINEILLLSKEDLDYTEQDYQEVEIADIKTVKIKVGANNE